MPGQRTSCRRDGGSCWREARRSEAARQARWCWPEEVVMPSALPALRTLLTGLAFGESPRWHDGRLWFSHWGAQEVVAVGLDGTSAVMVRVPTRVPFCIDWLPDGRLLIDSGR